MVWFSAAAVAVAEEPSVVSNPLPDTALGAPMRIAPAVIGQPMVPRAAVPRITDATKPPQLLIGPPEVATLAAPMLAEPPPIQLAGTNP